MALVNVMPVNTKFLKLKLKLTVVSDYLHVTGSEWSSCKDPKELFENPAGVKSYFPFTCLNGEPVLFGSSVKGAVRSRADLLLPIEPSVNFMGESRKRCSEIALAPNANVYQGGNDFPFICCQGGKIPKTHASWRHLLVWYQQVRRCKDEVEEDLNYLFGNGPLQRHGRSEIVPSKIAFNTFFPPEGTDVEVKEFVLAYRKGGPVRAWMEVVPQGTTFEGEVVMRNPDEKSIAALLFSLGLFKENPVILLGRFKYRKLTLNGKRVTFGRVRVDLQEVVTYGVEEPEGPREFIKKYREVFEDLFDVEPDYDEIEEVEKLPD